MDYIIEFDYNADEIDELTIRKGDIVNDVKPHEDGWLLGSLRGKSGVFPSNFGKPLKDEKKKSQEEISTDANEDNNAPIANTEETESVELRHQKKIGAVGFGNIFSGGKIQLKSNRDGKTVSVIEEVKLDLPVENKPVAKAKVMAKVIHSYKAENPDELNLEEGETVTVLDKENEDEGWWKCQLANGKIGVLPDNYVEIIKTPVPLEDTKPVRPANSAIVKGPPPVLSAKPVLNKAIPPRPPQLSDTKLTPAKPTLRSSNLDKEDGISFETPVNHKPLVGPNAGRAKRPGKKLPSSVNLATSVTTSEDNEDNLVIVSKQPSSKEMTAPSHSESSPNEIPNISKKRSKDSFYGESSSSTTSDNLKSKSRDISSSLDKAPEKTPDTVTVKPKVKDTVSFEKTSETPGTKTKFDKENAISASKSSESAESKSRNYFKSNSLSKKVIQDSESFIHSSDDLKLEIKGLSLKIGILEDENQELKGELSDLRKSSNDQINLLKIKLDKLINEFDEEKAKHALSEVKYNRLKGVVEDLEVAMASK